MQRVAKENKTQAKTKKNYKVKTTSLDKKIYLFNNCQLDFSMLQNNSYLVMVIFWNWKIEKKNCT